MKKAAKVVNPEDRITPGKILLYIVLILVSAFTLIPFVWMISASLKLDREVFTFPMKWIPETPHFAAIMISDSISFPIITDSSRSRSCFCRRRSMNRSSGFLIPCTEEIKISSKQS